MPLTAGPQQQGASGPGEMGQGSLPTSNGRTPCWGIRFLPRRRPHQGTLGSLHVPLMWVCGWVSGGRASQRRLRNLASNIWLLDKYSREPLYSGPLLLHHAPSSKGKKGFRVAEHLADLRVRVTFEAGSQARFHRVPSLIPIQDSATPRCHA